MKNAVSIPDAGPPAAIVDLAVEADRAGWDAVFLWDHLQLFPAMELDLVDLWSPSAPSPRPPSGCGWARWSPPSPGAAPTSWPRS